MACAASSPLPAERAAAAGAASTPAHKPSRLPLVSPPANGDLALMQCFPGSIPNPWRRAPELAHHPRPCFSSAGGSALASVSPLWRGALGYSSLRESYTAWIFRMVFSCRGSCARQRRAGGGRLAASARAGGQAGEGQRKWQSGGRPQHGMTCYVPCSAAAVLGNSSLVSEGPAQPPGRSAARTLRYRPASRPCL